jgi:phosphopantetheinyl transferase (holo-ACP synthase)
VSLLDTHLWLLNYDLVKSPTAIELDRLKPSQEKRALKLDGKRKVEFYLSRLLLNHAVDELLLETEDKAWSTKEREHLSPTIHHRNHTINTSISHSRGVIGILTTLTSAPVKLGLDLEIIRSTLNQESASFFCSEDQLTQANTLHQPHKKQQYFTQLWTQKEAYFKAHETPMLNENTQSMEFSQDQHMHSLSINNNVELSVYCEDLISIRSHIAQINNNGEVELKYSSLLK